MRKALAGLGVKAQVAIGIATPIGAYVICTRKAPWVVLVVLGLLSLNAVANGISLFREATRGQVNGMDTRFGILQRTAAGLSVISALMLMLSLA